MIFPKKLEKSILLFDGWNPRKEGRTDVGEEGLLGEVWIRPCKNGYNCVVVWYRKFLIFKLTDSIEVLFMTRGGGALKSLIRTTNKYFKRDDDVEGGVHTTDWDEW